MPRVEIEVNGRPYTLACQPGQEGRLGELAAYVDERLKQITGGRSGSDAQMLVITALVLADELLDLGSGRTVAPAASGPSIDEEAAAAALENIAMRIEEVASRLERA